ncbi:MAG: hypothetical protein J7J93_02900 [Candidatus Aenigmarchaeota archaeon]|nr:hypothetical protein [Candidatus Aenigmarchaeota archaeon]
MVNYSDQILSDQIKKMMEELPNYNKKDRIKNPYELLACVIHLLTDPEEIEKREERVRELTYISPRRFLEPFNI